MALLDMLYGGDLTIILNDLSHTHLRGTIVDSDEFMIQFRLRDPQTGAEMNRVKYIPFTSIFELYST